jgi:hypothetical protein
MAQRGNWIFPEGSFDTSFEERGSSYKAVGDASWLLEENLGESSPKAALAIRRAATCNGLVFIYSRFIKSGATPLALALEANGYTPWNRERLFIDGIQDNKGRQCAVCPSRENGHKGHRFVPAKYILVTGQANLSPNNAAAIQAAARGLSARRAAAAQRGELARRVAAAQNCAERSSLGDALHELSIGEHAVHLLATSLLVMKSN